MARLDFIANGENLITSNDLQFRVIGQIPFDIDSIEIELYQTSSDEKTVDKTLIPQSKKVLQGTLREGTSILNPIILVYCETSFNWNYCLIKATNRCYFITDIRMQNKNLYEMYLKCDVLMTYKQQILALETKVLRSESNHNWDYTDTLPPSKSYGVVGAYAGKITNGGFGYPKPNIPITSGDQIESYGHLLFKISCSELNHGSSISTPSFGYVWATASISGFERFLRKIYNSGYWGADYKITDVITDIKWIPTTLPTMKGSYRFVEGIVFGNSQNVSSMSGNYVYIGDMGRYDFRIGRDLLTSKETVEWSISNIPVQSRNYLNSPPFKEMAILFIPFGMVKIDSEIWGRKSTINLRAEIDSMSGNANLYIIDGSYKELIASANVALPIDLIYIAKSGREVASAVISSITGIVKAIPSGFLTIPHTKRKLNKMAKGGIDETISGGLESVLSTMITPSFYQVGGSGSADANAMTTPLLLIKRVEQSDPNLKTEGWLYNTTTKLAYLHGYCLVAPDVHLENMIGYCAATKPELDEIEALLTSGVILP